MLKPDGHLYVEDFAFFKPFDDNEKIELSNDFFANYLVSLSQYKTDLKEAGFLIFLLKI